MLRFAIIEDDDGDAIELQNCIADYLARSDVKAKVERFKSATAFVDKYTGGYDVIFMDIEMPGTNGLEASERIRKLDTQVVIIFVTATVQYAVDGYRVNAFDCVIKPVTASTFFKKLDRIIEYVGREKSKTITIRTPQGIIKQPLNEIYYVEVTEHYLAYHTEKGDIRVYGKLSDIEEFLTSNGFFRCNRCYIVNMRFVKSFVGDTVEIGGDKLLISRRRRQDFMQALTYYFGGR